MLPVTKKILFKKSDTCNDNGYIHMFNYIKINIMTEIIYLFNNELR